MPTVIPMFQPRGDTIAELLMRQGDVQARAALMRADALSRGIEGVGQAVAQGVQAWGQQKDQKKREAMLDEAMMSFDPADPRAFYRKAAVAVGPESAARLMSGLSSMMKVGQGQEPNPADLKAVLGSLSAARKVYQDEGLAQRWGTMAPLLKNYEPLLGAPVPDQYTPEVGDWIDGTLAGMTEKKDEGGFNLSPGQVRFDAEGKQIAAVPKEPEAYNLSPGQVRYQGGEVVAQGPPREVNQAAAAMAQARLEDREEKKREREAEIESYVNAVGAGDYTIDKVPPTIQRQVMVEAQRRGMDVRTSKQKETDAAAEQTIESLRQLRDQAERTMTATTGPGAVVQGKVQRGLSWVGLAAETEKWDKQAAKLSLLARQLGEKGVLTDRDVERVVEMLPKLTNRASIRDKALKDLEDIIYTGMRGRVSSRVKVPGGNEPIVVTAPNGKKYTFRSQEEADKFKAAAGIR